ncbi:MAG: DNA translocase FtsK [Actinomycetota bacterium]|nr:DNA translocase FtsK [Actinomycetota bacterium]
MATGKRAPKKTAKKRTSGKGKSKRKGTSTLTRVREGLTGALSREAVGVFLLAVGLFFGAAFASGRGSFLGDAGSFVSTQLLGSVGLALAPLAVVAGLLLLLGRLRGRLVAGTALLLLAGAASFAATLAPRHQFSARHYPEAGGVLGSGIYAGVEWAAGAIGAALTIALLYVVGLSLLTGVSFAAALGALRVVGEKVAGLGRGLWEKRSGRPEPPAKRGRTDPAKVRETAEPDAWDEDEGVSAEPDSGPSEGAKTREFEVVLPDRGPELGFSAQRELAPGEYTPPPFSMLSLGQGDPEHDAEGTSRRLTLALSDLGVEAHVVRAVVGPRVTRYELRLGSGVKVGKVRNLQQDIAYALAATEVRILAPIPGKSAVGVEVPNTRPAKVTLGDVFRAYPDENDWTLPVGLGKDISGRAVFFDLSEMPHLLVAGTTGSGKSVMLNGLLTSLLLTTDPRQVKMVLIDPKRVELSQFGRVPHLITPVVTDVKKAANALGWAVAEMERRYEVLEKNGLRSVEGYNDRAEVQIPYVVVVIDELADLMMQAGAKVEDAIIRLAQKARAVGIHIVVATQRPSVDVITGMIKANVPSRIAFAVSSQVDSRVILDSPGAEALLGMGDMLYKPVSAARPSRVQGAFISEAEVDRVVSATVEAASGSAEARFVEEVTEPRSVKEENDEPDDDLLPEAASFVVSTQQASVSAVQRRFRVGYSRAGRIIDALERKGVVGPYEGSKSRAVVASTMDLETLFGEDEGRSERAEGW